ncbi:MAG: putative esterase, partial [Planctomycetota bacterium]
MRTFFYGLLLTLSLLSVAPAQELGTDVESGMQARIGVINQLVAGETADDFFAQGEAARDRNQIAPALIAFLTAYRMDHERFDAAFEVARLFTAWDEAELGWTWLGKSVDAGYWSESELGRDGLIASHRTRAGFGAMVARVRANYTAILPSLIGLTEVRVPEGEAPAGGWPMLLCLHGYGTDQRDLLNLAEVGASKGFYSVTICGFKPVSPGRYSWPNEGPAIAEYIHKTLAPYRENPACNAETIYTTGFSQGGLVATYLVASDPERYRGAIPISPAGPLIVPLPKEGAPARPLFMLYGLAEGSGVKNNVTRFQGGFEQTGSRVQLVTHPAGH